MRTRTRDWLFRLALAAVPAIAACDNGGFNPTPDDPCNIPRAADYSIDLPAAPSLTLKLESCRLDADACTNLCSAEIQADNKFGQITACNVTFYPDTVSVSVSFNESTCFGEGDGGPAPVQGGPK